MELYSPELPEVLIQRIQSLLDLKKAAQTTLLSKSWHVARSTSPTIDLDEAYFPPPCYSSYWRHHKLSDFTKLANKTFEMHEQSNNLSRIHAFRLRLVSPEFYIHTGLATKWTLKALNLGATDFTFEINHPDKNIPFDAVSGSEKVATLCLESSNLIDPLMIVQLPALKSLALHKLKMTRASFLKVISCFPLIENLSLSDIRGAHGTNNDDTDHAPPPKFFLHKLKSLVLGRVSPEFQIKPLFLDGLSSKFPNLKHLTLNLSFQRQKGVIIISSRSLEVLNFSVDKDENDNEKNEGFEFDVPSIREFILDCTSYMPNLFFTSTDRRCKSRVSLTYHGRLSIQWFRNLSKFLTGLRGSNSNIHLFLRVDNRHSFNYQPGDIKCLNVCELENLTMSTKGLSSLSFQALLDGLFRICRPKMITQCNITPPCDDKDDDEMYVDDAGNTINNDVVLCRLLQDGMKLKSLMMIPSQYMYDLRDLEELNVHKFFNGAWRSQPLDSILLDDSSKQTRFRLQLKWRPTEMRA